MSTDERYENYKVDYAIVTRMYEPATGQMIVAITGLGLHATAAASEFVTSPTYMAMVAGWNTFAWKQENMQIVISAKVAGTSWGPPELLATYFW